MRDVIMWEVMSLDGFFEGPQSGDIGWFDLVWGEELAESSLEQAEEADTLLLDGDMLHGQGALILPLVAIVMVAVGFASVVGPAREGLRIQPTEALREE